MTQTRQPSEVPWEELLELVRRETMLELRVCLPARVVAWVKPEANRSRPTPPRARVRIDLLWAREGAQEDAAPSEKYIPPEDPSLPGELTGEYAEGSLLVPVHFPGAWGSWSRGPLLAGELGKLVFCDRSLDVWQVEGGVGDPLDPGWDHAHGFNLHDAWFEPGVRSGMSLNAAKPGASVILDDAHQVGLADGSAGLTIRLPGGDPNTQRNIELSTTGAVARIDAASKVVAGDPATAKAVALAEAVVEIFESIASAFTTWAPPAAPTIDNGAALKTAALFPVSGFVAKINALKGQIAALKLKAD